SAYGCPHLLALASWLTEHLIDQTIDLASSLDQTKISEALNMPKEKLNGVLIAEDALRRCLDQPTSI
ncbi:MAG: hypothetical protein HKM24_03530, partial [Gammaproteobacteria bacterium]|nr:hypothetical protein [Gammaproteobacteria bacterium]